MLELRILVETSLGVVQTGAGTSAVVDGSGLGLHAQLDQARNAVQQEPKNRYGGAALVADGAIAGRKISGRRRGALPRLHIRVLQALQDKWHRPRSGKVYLYSKRRSASSLSVVATMSRRARPTTALVGEKLLNEVANLVNLL